LNAGLCREVATLAEWMAIISPVDNPSVAEEFWHRANNLQ
jgi:hypothetical protein